MKVQCFAQVLGLFRVLTVLSLFTFHISTASAEGTVITLVDAKEDRKIEFSMEQISAYPRTTILTENDFTDGMVSYTGPLVRNLLEQVSMDDAELVRFTAANDYYVDIPTADFHKYDVILAFLADGKQLSRRERGPLWLMYPISDHPELDGNPVYNTRLIWQVVKIETL